MSEGQWRGPNYPSTEPVTRFTGPDCQWMIWRSQFYMLMFGAFCAGMTTGMLLGILMILKFA